MSTEPTAIEAGQAVYFTPLPLQLPCPVPVTPDGRTVGDDGQPLPIEQRTERCAVSAHWMVGSQVACDIHTEHFCCIGGIDFDELVLSAGRRVDDARVPWADRPREPQEAAERIHKIMAAAAAKEAPRS